jgi:hypothetical protein
VAAWISKVHQPSKPLTKSKTPAAMPGFLFAVQTREFVWPDFLCGREV